MRFKTIIILILISLLLVAALVVSGLLVSDGDPRSYTRRELTVLAECILEMHERRIDLSHFHTLSEFIKAAEVEQMLFVTSPDEFYLDGWRHPFHWKTKQESKQLIIIIESDGRNGVQEGGAGDD